MNKTVLISGVTGGLGESIAERFIENGYFVIGTYARNIKKATVLKNKFGENNLKLYCIDQSMVDIVGHKIKKIINENKKIDIFIVNSGTTRDEFLFNMSYGAWKHVIDVNLISSIKLAKVIFDNMKKYKKGRIIFISSVSGVYGREGQSNYASTKGGLIGLMQLLSSQVEADEDIVINSLAPGMIDTEMINSVDRRILDNFINVCSAKRIGKPNDVAELVYLLATIQHNYLNSTLINLDGGFLK